MLGTTTGINGSADARSYLSPQNAHILVRAGAFLNEICSGSCAHLKLPSPAPSELDELELLHLQRRKGPSGSFGKGGQGALGPSSSLQIPGKRQLRLMSLSPSSSGALDLDPPKTKSTPASLHPKGNERHRENSRLYATAGRSNHALVVPPGCRRSFLTAFPTRNQDRDSQRLPRDSGS